MKRVAFIGLGRMGHGMAGRYLDAGFQVATGGILVWFLLAGPILQAAQFDRAARTGLAIAAAVVLIDAAAKVRRIIGRSRPPVDYVRSTPAR